MLLRCKQSCRRSSELREPFDRSRRYIHNFLGALSSDIIPSWYSAFWLLKRFGSYAFTIRGSVGHSLLLPGLNPVLHFPFQFQLHVDLCHFQIHFQFLFSVLVSIFSFSFVVCYLKPNITYINFFCYINLWYIPCNEK